LRDIRSAVHWNATSAKLRSLRQRSEILGALRALPLARPAADDEVMRFIDAHALHGSGLGWAAEH